MLSHVNKRVRGHDQIKLPLDALLDLYLSDTSAPLVKNFAVVYVEMAMDRSLQDQQTAAVRFLPFLRSQTLFCVAMVPDLKVTCCCTVLHICLMHYWILYCF